MKTKIIEILLNLVTFTLAEEVHTDLYKIDNNMNYHID